MIRKTSLHFIWLFLFMFTTGLSSQEESPSVTPFPAPSTDAFPFPNGMYCNEIEPALGPFWRGIKIGRTTFDEFEQQLFELSAEYFIVERPDPANLGILYRVPHNVAVENQIPRTIIVCVADDTIISLMVSDSSFQERTLSLDDWIANPGEPDAVTWSTDLTKRVVFWFPEGIALDVFIGEPEYGTILKEFYLPYQDANGYEARFPYNRTAIVPFVGDVVRQPPIPTEQNPFDFDAMVATITAEPSRTPTPTITPAATATP